MRQDCKLFYVVYLRKKRFQIGIFAIRLWATTQYIVYDYDLMISDIFVLKSPLAYIFLQKTRFPAPKTHGNEVSIELSDSSENRAIEFGLWLVRFS